MAKTQFGRQVKVVRKDNGTKFKSGPMKIFYHGRGIIHQTSCVDILLNKNGRLEHHQQHLLDVATTLQFQANLSLNLWGELC